MLPWSHSVRHTEQELMDMMRVPRPETVMWQKVGTSRAPETALAEAQGSVAFRHSVTSHRG